MLRSVLKKNRTRKEDGCARMDGGITVKEIVRKDSTEEVIF